MKGAVVELRVYILDSFGSYERLDFGTGINIFIFLTFISNAIKGHELSFAVFLYCLKELGYYGKEDYEKAIRNVFYRLR